MSGRGGRIAVAIAVAATCGLAASASDHKNIVRFAVAWIAPTGDWSSDVFLVEDIDGDTRLELSGEAIIEADDEIGLAMSYERRFNDRIGLELGLIGSEHDVDVRLRGTARVIRNVDGEVLDQVEIDDKETIGDVIVTPWIVGANVYVLTRPTLEVYLGPFVAYVLYGDLKENGERSEIDDELTWGGVVGVDVPFGLGHWTVSVAGRYLTTGATLSEPGGSTIDFDPFIVHAGVGYRF